MITRAGRFGLHDYSGQNEITVYNNWNSLVSGNKFFKLQIGKESVIVEAEELRYLITLLSPSEEAIKLVPSITKEVKEYAIPVSLVLPRDGRKGEVFNSVITTRI